MVDRNGGKAKNSCQVGMYPVSYKVEACHTIHYEASVRMDTTSSNLSCLPTASNIRLLALLYHFLIIYCPIFLAVLHPSMKRHTHLTPGWSDDRNGSEELFMYFCTTEIRIMIGFYCYK